MVRSFFIKLAMLSATLSIVAWMGWTVPPNRGEAGPVESPAGPDLRDVHPPPVTAEVVPRQTPPARQPMSVTPAIPPRRPPPVKSQLDVNQATVREFEQLPGIGPVLAQRIIDHRRSHGLFATVDGLLFVKGLGPKKLDRLREHVTVHTETSLDGQKGRL